MATNELLEAYEEGVLRLTLNRPRKRNALTRALLQGLQRTLEAHAGRADLRCALICGSGDQAFAAGGDLVDVGNVREREAAERFALEATAALDAVRRFPVPTLALLNGLAIGGGAELALACDMRIAAPHAQIGFVHANLNIVPAWGGGADLMRLVGHGKGIELLLSGRLVDAGEAQALGLINAIAPAGESLEACVERFVSSWRARPPHVLRAIKALALAERLAQPAAERVGDERERFVRTWIHADHWSIADRLLK